MSDEFPQDVISPLPVEIIDALTTLNNSGQERVFTSETPLVDVGTNQPNWLPAAIILPIVAVIIMTLMLVCMLTRASRVFRSRKTVLVNDPSKLPTILHNYAITEEVNGKSNPAFEPSPVDQESLSKI